MGYFPYIDLTKPKHLATTAVISRFAKLLCPLFDFI